MNWSKIVFSNFISWYNYAHYHKTNSPQCFTMHVNSAIRNTMKILPLKNQRIEHTIRGKILFFTLHARMYPLYK